MASAWRDDSIPHKDSALIGLLRNQMNANDSYSLKKVMSLPELEIWTRLHISVFSNWKQI